MSFGQKQYWLSVDACSRRAASAKALVEAIKLYEVGQLESGWHSTPPGRNGFIPLEDFCNQYRIPRPIAYIGGLQHEDGLTPTNLSGKVIALCANYGLGKTRDRAKKRQRKRTTEAGTLGT